MEWAEYSKYMFEKCKEAGKPFQASFEMTPFCNFKCNMCYVRLDPEQAKAQGESLSTEQWMRIASEAKGMGVTILEVTGGEAITRPDFPVLYEAFIKMGFLIHLRSNGYLIRNKTLDLLKRLKPRRISVTMYGASDETYKKVCGISDGFSVVSENVLAMREAGLNVRLVMTVTNDNLNDLNTLKKWAAEYNMKVNAYGGLFTPVRGAKRSIEHLQVQLPEEEYDVSDELLQASQHETDERQALLDPFWMCRSFGAKCCISWDGRMTICNTMTAVWSDPVRDGFEEAYSNLYRDLKKLRRPQECTTCPYIECCGACPSQFLSATGDPEKTCDAVCKLAKKRYKRHYTIEIAMQKTKKGNNANKNEEGDIFCEDQG